MILLDLNIEELEELLASYDCRRFRALQLYKWLASGCGFSEMSDLPKSLRDMLSCDHIAQPIKISESIKSKDGSVKFLYELCDGNIIEGVFMPHDYGNSLCVSTQVGCRMGCEFCASGIGGLVRNLTAGEILGQVVSVNKFFGGNLSDRKITNIVLMGSGEPLDNYDNTVKFIETVSAPYGINIGQRSVSLSTCGIVDKMRELADLQLGVTLSVSLHATLDEYRRKLMPIANKYSVTDVVSAARYYFKKTGRRVVFEYSMVKGVNMNFADVRRLAEITKGMSAHVNLIMLNKVDGKNIAGCTKQEGERFCMKLRELGVSATVRRSMGSDIAGACGQLRRNRIKV